MSDYYCTISVESSNIDEIKKIIDEQIGKAPFNIWIYVEDRSEIYKCTSDFMIEQGLEEQDPVLRSLDLTNFTTDIELYCAGNNFGLPILDIIADAIGATISKVMNTRTLVTLTNQETPFCMFNCGHRSRIFLEENREYFKGKFWLPATLKL